MMRSEFWSGFEKEAKIREAALAALLAASPVSAKAGGKALQTAAKAADKQWGHVIKKKAPEAVKKVQQTASKGVSPAGGGKLSIKDLSRLHYKRGPFQASVGGGGDLKTKYNVGKGLDIVGKKRGGSTYAGVSYKKEF